VDSCGRLFRNIDPPIDRSNTGHQSQEYFDFIGKYKFMICFENKSQPYYLTEKLINAYHSGTIPIYWGCPNTHDFVNLDAILYLKPDYTESDVSELIQEIVRLDQDDDAYRAKFESIFFKTLPDEFDLVKMKEKIQHTLCKVFPSTYVPISGTTGWSKVCLEDALKEPSFRPYIASNYENPLFYFSPGPVDFSKVVPGISRDGVWTLSREEIHRYPKSYYESIDYFVIHCSDNEERSKNIDLQEKKLGHPIQRFPAIMGKEILLNRLDQYDPRIRYTPFREQRGMNEIGCYLSHLTLLQSRKHLKTGYTVIFEDDFHIVEDLNIRDLIQEAGEFDILYLGHWTNLQRYTHVKGPIYEYNHSGPLYCLHAYVLANRQIESMYETLLDIREPIDWVFMRLLNQTYRGKIVHPQKVIQNRDQMESIIGPIL
jgi:GR25 family glycosyltransferase involved in LPS biosynthesis